MNQTKALRQEIENIPQSKLIFAGRFYRERLNNIIDEVGYYKYLERLCQSGLLAKVGKGVYCRPQKTKFGCILPSEKEIVNQITANNCGVEVGYKLYNRLNLTTQISKTSRVFSSYIDGKTKRIGNIYIKNYPIRYSEKIAENISMLEVLLHFNEIEELNLSGFKRLCVRFAENYDEKSALTVIDTMHYPKRTIAFLKQILDSSGVKNSLGKYLSSLSDYKIPDLAGVI